MSCHSPQCGCAPSHPVKGYINNPGCAFPLPLPTFPPQLLTRGKDVKEGIQALSACAGLLFMLEIWS